MCGIAGYWDDSEAGITLGHVRLAAPLGGAMDVAGSLSQDGVNGFLLLPPGNAETLSDRICPIADDPEPRARIGRADRETVRVAFDARREASRIGALFSGQAGPDLRPAPLEPVPRCAASRDTGPRGRY